MAQNTQNNNSQENKPVVVYYADKVQVYNPEQKKRLPSQVINKAFVKTLKNKQTGETFHVLEMVDFEGRTHSCPLKVPRAQRQDNNKEGEQ